VLSAVIDNTALVYLTQLHQKRPFIELLRNIINPLFIPIAVKNEYAMGLPMDANRSWVLDRLDTEQGFYRLCTSYDSFVNIVVENFKGIDKGEAETYSQFKKISAQLIISDDKDFTKAIHQLDRGLKVYNSLHLICWLDVLQFLPMDWSSILKLLHNIRPFHSRDLREAYLEIAARNGLSLPSKRLSRKCSLKAIL
jgi:hypothetical protein